MEEKRMKEHREIDAHIASAYPEEWSSHGTAERR